MANNYNSPPMRNNSGCLTALVSGFSRLMLLMYWFARPAHMQAVFNTFIIPCLGFIVLPFTTLMYVLLWSPQVGLQGLDWLWIAIAVVLDLASIAASGATNRNRIPAGYPGSTYTN
jgi:fructose-specific phosphotransferase system IIC component